MDFAFSSELKGYFCLKKTKKLKINPAPVPIPY